jgi:CubicO group peptidase (beta-lactamase class C family)
MTTLHGIKIEVADSFPKRAKGLLGRTGLPSGEGLLIPKCNAIHTIGMRFPIDAEFLDRNGSTVRVVRDIPPGRFCVWGGWRARQVLETQAGTVRVRERIHQLIADGIYAGLIVADADGGPILLEGLQCFQAKKLPVSEETRCDIASVGKLFTASMCALLVTDGKLDPDAPFTEYLPEHVLAKENCDITVRDLASHSGGFDNSKPYQVPDTAQFLEKLWQKRPVRPRRERFEYACSNFIYLGKIVEKLTGLDLDAAARKMIWGPLGMTHTTWNPIPDDGHVMEYIDSTYPPFRRIGDHNDASCFYSPVPLGNGSVFTTIGDMRLFLSDMLHRKHFPAAYYDLLFKREYEQGGVRRTFGWDMKGPNSPTYMTDETGFSDQAICHSGWTGPAVAVDPVRGRAAVVLGNRTGDMLASRLGRIAILSHLCYG